MSYRKKNPGLLGEDTTTPGGQNLPADPPSFGLMLPNKLLLIFMKGLNAFWCKKKKKNSK